MEEKQLNTWDLFYPKKGNAEICKIAILQAPKPKPNKQMVSFLGMTIF